MSADTMQRIAVRVRRCAKGKGQPTVFPSLLKSLSFPLRPTGAQKKIRLVKRLSQNTAPLEPSSAGYAGTFPQGKPMTVSAIRAV